MTDRDRTDYRVMGRYEDKAAAENSIAGMSLAVPSCSTKYKLNSDYFINI